MKKLIISLFVLFFSLLTLYSCKRAKTENGYVKCTEQMQIVHSTTRSVFEYNVKNYGLSKIDSTEVHVIYYNSNKEKTEKRFGFTIGIKLKNNKIKTTGIYSSDKKYILDLEKQLKAINSDSLCFEVRNEYIVSIYTKERWKGKNFINKKLIWN